MAYFPTKQSHWGHLLRLLQFLMITKLPEAQLLIAVKNLIAFIKIKYFLKKFLYFRWHHKNLALINLKLLYDQYILIDVHYFQRSDFLPGLLQLDNWSFVKSFNLYYNYWFHLILSVKNNWPYSTMLFLFQLNLKQTLNYYNTKTLHTNSQALDF